MARLIAEPAMTEPLVLMPSFATGFDMEVCSEFVRIVFWDDLLTLDGDQPERRIVQRLILPAETARKLLKELRRAAHKGGH